MERVWLVLAIFAAFGTRGTYEDIITIPKGVIDDHCNQTVSNPQDVEDAGYVQTQTDLTDFLRVVGYDDNADCSITLVAPANHKFLIQWTQPIDFEYANGCRDWVRVHDGYENDTSLYDMGELCIFSSVEATDNLTKATTGNVVTVTVHTDSTASDNKGFKLLYTVFYDPDNGSCSGTDYLCSNDRCVSESLKCDFQNHCGDNSDESKTLASCPDLPDVIINFITNVLKLSVGAFIGICVAIGLVLILIIVLCICCCCKCCGCCQSTRAAPV